MKITIIFSSQGPFYRVQIGKLWIGVTVNHNIPCEFWVIWDSHNELWEITTSYPFWIHKVYRNKVKQQ